MLSLICFMSEVSRYIALNACVKYCTKDETKKDQSNVRCVEGV